MTRHLHIERRYRQLAWSVALAAVGYLVFALWAGWRDVSDAFAVVGVRGLALALLLSLLNYGLRFIRWQCYLGRLGLRLDRIASLRIYVAGFALTTTPGKAGEMLRGVFLKRHGLSYGRGVAAFISERLSDLVAIVMLALLGLGNLPHGDIFILVGVACVIFGQLLLGYGETIRNGVRRLGWVAGRAGAALDRLLGVVAEARVCHGPRMLLLATVLSVLAWAAEAWAFYLVLAWLGFDIGLGYAFSVYALAMLAGALSFMPGGLGGAEAVMSGLLIWAGMEASLAVAATVIIRLATLWFAVVLGVVALLMEQGRERIAAEMLP